MQMPDRTLRQTDKVFLITARPYPTHPTKPRYGEGGIMRGIRDGE